MKVLFAIPDPQDLLYKDLNSGIVAQGPLLSVISKRSFDIIVLLNMKARNTDSEKIQAVIQKHCPSISLEMIDLDVHDTSDYRAIFVSFCKFLFPFIQSKKPTQCFFCAGYNPAEIQAAWLLFSTLKSIDFEFIQTQESRSYSHNKPSIQMIIFSNQDFFELNTFKNRLTTKEPSSEIKEGMANQYKLIGNHPLFLNAVKTAKALAEYSIPVLLQGETGTGKDVFARFIHEISSRKDENFVVVNCAAIPESLAESTLFGHQKGAFTGAVKDEIGKFRQADKGTLFLDEIGELPLSIQAKLLRVLEDGMVEAVGSTLPKKVDVRLIAATNRNLKNEIKKCNFREDLYYRLRTGEIKIPSLRERSSDIYKIALFILSRVNQYLKEPKQLSVKALEALTESSWPGNIRDLQNVIERACILTPNSVIETEDLVIPSKNTEAGEEIPMPHFDKNFSLEDYLSNTRVGIIRHALKISEGNQSEASRLLGISPQAVNKFIQKHEAKNRPNILN